VRAAVSPRTFPRIQCPRIKIAKLIADFFAGKKVPVLTAVEAVIEEAGTEEEDE